MRSFCGRRVMVLLLDLDGSQDWQLRSWFQARACFLHQGEYDPDKGDNLQLGISSIHFSELSSSFHSGSPATRGTFTGDTPSKTPKTSLLAVLTRARPSSSPTASTPPARRLACWICFSYKRGCKLQIGPNPLTGWTHVPQHRTDLESNHLQHSQVRGLAKFVRAG